MKTCPVCELELPDPVPPFCPRCAWDLKNDPTLTVFLSPIPDEVVEEYRQRFGIAKENWRKSREVADRQKEMESELGRIQKRLVEIESRERKRQEEEEAKKQEIEKLGRDLPNSKAEKYFRSEANPAHFQRRI